MIRSVLVKIAWAVALLVLFARSLCNLNEEPTTVEVNAVNQCQGTINVHLRSVLNAYVGLKFSLTDFQDTYHPDTVLISRTDTLGIEENLGALIVSCRDVPVYNEENPDENTVITQVTLTEPEKNHLVATIGPQDEEWIKVIYIDYMP